MMNSRSQIRACRIRKEVSSNVRHGPSRERVIFTKASPHFNTLVWVNALALKTVNPDHSPLTHKSLRFGSVGEIQIKVTRVSLGLDIRVNFFQFFCRQILLDLKNNNVKHKPIMLCG